MGFFKRATTGGRASFTIALRGYERMAVDRFVEQLRTAPPGTVTVPEFTIVLRGYDPTQVDEYIRAALAGRDDPS